MLAVRNVPLVTAPLESGARPDLSWLTFTAHADRVAAEFRRTGAGNSNAEHSCNCLRGERSGYDFRPQVVGVFTDLGWGRRHRVRASASVIPLQQQPPRR